MWTWAHVSFRRPASDRRTSLYVDNRVYVDNRGVTAPAAARTRAQAGTAMAGSGGGFAGQLAAAAATGAAAGVAGAAGAAETVLPLASRESVR